MLVESPLHRIDAPVRADRQEGGEVTSSAEYRDLAQASRIAASQEVLPQRRRCHEASAERWEEMATRAAEIERKTVLNRIERAAHPYHQTIRMQR